MTDPFNRPIEFRVPSVRTLIERLGQPSDAARRLRAAMKQPLQPRTAVARLEQIDTMLQNHGVESIGLHDGRWIHYSNAGDPYATTILLDQDARRFFVGDWGTLVERYGAD